MRKQGVIRVAYLFAVLAPLAVGWLFVSGQIWDLMGPFWPKEHWLSKIISGAAGVPLVVIAGVLLYLAYRPQWWGKIACLFASVSWIGFALTSRLQGPPNPVRWVPAAAGGSLLLVAIVHHLADPSFGPFGPKKGSDPAPRKGPFVER